MIRVHVAQQHRNAIHVVDDHVDFAIVEDVAKCCAAAHGHHGEARSLHGRDQFELAILQIVIEQWALRIALSPLRMLVHLRIDMAIHNQQILPSVVVVIEKSIGKADKRYGRLGDSGLITDIGEEPGSIVLKQHVVVVGKSRY